MKISNNKIRKKYIEKNNFKLNIYIKRHLIEYEKNTLYYINFYSEEKKISGKKK